MEVVGFTEQVADLRMRYQVIYMKDSAFIWVQPGEDGIGSLPSLSVAMATTMAQDALPPATTIAGGDADASSQLFAQKVGRRCGMSVLACVDLPEGASVIRDLVFRRVVTELERHRKLM